MFPVITANWGHVDPVRLRETQQRPIIDTRLLDYNVLAMARAYLAVTRYRWSHVYFFP